MSTLTIRIANDKHERLKNLAAARHISVNKLIDELATIALTEHDTYLRFLARAKHGSAEQGLMLLDKLNQVESLGNKD